VVFDVMDKKSFDSVRNWKMDIDDCLRENERDTIPVILVANKCDLVGKEGWGKTKEEMNRFCEENRFVSWFETSSISGVGIEEVFDTLVNLIYEMKSKEYETNVQNQISSNDIRKLLLIFIVFMVYYFIVIYVNYTGSYQLFNIKQKHKLD